MTGSVAGFLRRDDVLTCDDVPLADIGRAFGTPTYVYSAALLTERFRALDAAFAAVPHRLHYALKANSTMAVVRRLREAGAAADANSGGELEVALRAGFQPAEIVFTGVGKTRAELERAVSLGLAAINAESPGEVERIAAIGRALGRVVDVAVRINPDVDAGSHPHISTGSRITKFGVPFADAPALVESIAAKASLRLVGLHVHVGSQITSTAPLAKGAAAIADFARQLLANGVPLRHLDFGGGLGIPYEDGQAVVTPEDYAAAVLPGLRATGLTLLLEPGRWIVGPAAVLLTQVVDLKRRADDGWFVIVDAGMNDLMRPALYGAFHRVEPVAPRPGAAILADIVGPICETTDTLAAGRHIAPVEVGDWIVVRDAGAYGAAMASNYLRRPIAAEVMVEDGRPRLIRRRQSVDDMLQWDL